MQLEDVKAKCGCWRASGDSPNFHRCPDFIEAIGCDSTACKGGLVESQCREHHTGIFCGACVEGYRVQDDGNCRECREKPGSTWSLFFSALLLVGTVVVLLVTPQWVLAILFRLNN